MGRGGLRWAPILAVDQKRHLAGSGRKEDEGGIGFGL